MHDIRKAARDVIALIKQRIEQLGNHPYMERR
jgi:hypothetical protein